jgi:hypothetical protein
MEEMDMSARGKITGFPGLESSQGDEGDSALP